LSLRFGQRISFLSMAKSLCNADEQDAPVNLISFLKAIPDGRYRAASLPEV